MPSSVPRGTQGASPSRDTSMWPCRRPDAEPGCILGDPHYLLRLINHGLGFLGSRHALKNAVLATALPAWDVAFPPARPFGAGWDRRQHLRHHPPSSVLCAAGLLPWLGARPVPPLPGSPRCTPASDGRRRSCTEPGRAQGQAVLFFGCGAVALRPARERLSVPLAPSGSGLIACPCPEAVAGSSWAVSSARARDPQPCPPAGPRVSARMSRADAWCLHPVPVAESGCVSHRTASPRRPSRAVPVCLALSAAPAEPSLEADLR